MPLSFKSAPDESFKSSLLKTFKQLLPTAIIVLLILLEKSPQIIPGLHFVTPPLAVAALFHFTVYQPDKLGYVTVFCLGLFADLLSATPPGLNTLLFLLLFLGTAQTQKYFYNRPFFWMAGGFALYAAALFLLRWLLTVVYYGTFLPAKAVVATYILLLLFYPFIAALCGLLNFRFLNDER